MVQDITHAAQQYIDAGWQVVPTNGKVVAAKGITGKGGEVRSVLPREGQNVAIRLPDGVIGIDIDHHSGKTGMDTIVSLAKEWGMLPRTDYSSSRPAPNGILLYRVPKGLEFVSGFDGVDIIQHGHRYVMVAPSVHDKTGEVYQWHTVGDEPLWTKGPDSLPMLPSAWVEGLTKAETSNVPEKSSEAHTEVLTDGEPCDEVTAALDSFTWKVEHGFARHDSMVGSQFRLVQLGAQGHPGVSAAMDTLEAMFLDAIGSDRDASSEWNDALDGALRRTGDITNDGDPCEEEPFALPRKFWNARPELQHIRAAAHSRGSSADVVFYALLARMSAMIDHRVRVNTGVLSPASLNTFVIVLGESGTGKTSGVAGALDELMPAPEHREGFQDGIILGSGEGAVETFFGKKWVKTERTGKDGNPIWEKPKVQVRHNVFAHVDEGEQLVKTLDRNGATLGPILRTMWVGSSVGMQNASEETTRRLDSGTYAFGVVMGFQPSTVEPLLKDSGSGMAQRFLWAQAEDKTIPYERTEHPGPLTGYALDNDASFTDDPIMHYSEELKDLTYRERVDANRGVRPDDFDEYDSHRPLTLAKISGLLALLNGRNSVTQEDYDLAILVWDTSRAVRNRAREEVRNEKRREEERQNDKVVRLEARKEVARQQSSGETRRLADKLVEKVIQNGPMRRGSLKKTMNSKKRDLFQEALNTAILAGELCEEDGVISLRIAEAA